MRRNVRVAALLITLAAASGKVFWFGAAHADPQRSPRPVDATRFSNAYEQLAHL